MLDVTINMTLKDYEKLISLLNKAYENTTVVSNEAIDPENIKWAHAQICEALITLGCNK